MDQYIECRKVEYACCDLCVQGIIHHGLNDAMTYAGLEFGELHKIKLIIVAVHPLLCNISNAGEMIQELKDNVATAHIADKIQIIVSPMPKQDAWSLTLLDDNTQVIISVYNLGA